MGDERKHTWESLFTVAWPDVPVEDASEGDKRLFSDHADSLNTYEEARNA